MSLTYRVNSDYWRVLDSGASIQKAAGFSDRTEKAMRKAAMRNGGVKFLRTAAGASATTGLINGSTTLTDDSTLKLDLKGGVWYEINASILVTQATAADGYKVGFSFSGTQTSAVVAGGYRASDTTNGTLDDAKGITATAPAFTATGTGAAGGEVNVTMRIKPQNDTTMTIQIAEQATAGGGAGAIIAAGSIVEISVLR